MALIAMCASVARFFYISILCGLVTVVTNAALTVWRFCVLSSYVVVVTVCGTIVPNCFAFLRDFMRLVVCNCLAVRVRSRIVVCGPCGVLLHFCAAEYYRVLCVFMIFITYNV